jgi:hypothetical protein
MVNSALQIHRRVRSEPNITGMPAISCQKAALCQYRCPSRKREQKMTLKHSPNFDRAAGVKAMEQASNN